MVAEEGEDDVAAVVDDVPQVLRVLVEVGLALDLCANQPVSWDVGAKLENSLARSNRSRFG